MIRLLLIAARNLKRNRARTLLTVLGTAVALIAFVMLRTVLTSWTISVEYAAKDRLGTRHKVSFVLPLPKRYADDMRQVPGIKEVTYANWFGARDPKRPNEFFATMAVDGPTMLNVYTDMALSEDVKTRWLANKRGAIVGPVLAKRMGWNVGDKIVLEGTIYPGDWEFVIDGIYTAKSKALDEASFFFHWSYLNEALPAAQRDKIGWVMSRIDDPSKSGSISAAVDKIFDERDEQTVTMSERAMNASFMGMFGAILTALDIVSVIILIIMAMILGNTIAMGVRERTREYAVLRALGFEPWHVRFFVIAEASVLGVTSGAVGVALAYPFVNGFVSRVIDENMGAWFPYFRVEPQTCVLAFVIAMVLAGSASLLPALQAGRISVTEALRRVG